MTTTHVLETNEADITYDVRGPLPTADGRPPLFMIAQPMDASGFATLASYFPDRTVVTYDPRGLGRSRRRDSPRPGGVSSVRSHHARRTTLVAHTTLFRSRRALSRQRSRYQRVGPG